MFLQSLLSTLNIFFISTSILIIPTSVFLNIEYSHSMQEEKYYELEEDSQANEPLETDDLDNDESRNPDPEFMEEVEPGEYDQSDDTTELDNSGY